MYLQKLIEQITLEVILEIRTGFKWSEFKELYNQLSKSNYAKRHLKLLDFGSSREVFLLSNRHVLKLARPVAEERGVAQNEAELNIYTDPKTKPVVAKIYDAADDYTWLVSELVRPLKSNVEFKSLIGVNMADFIRIMDFVKMTGSTEKAIKEYEEAFYEAKFLKKYKDTFYDINYSDEAKQIEIELELLKNNEFVRATAALVSDVGLVSGDLSFNGHWGKTPDGRVVILDYGFTEKVARQLYGM